MASSNVQRAARLSLGLAVLSAAAGVTASAQTTPPETDPVKAYSTIGMIPGETLRLDVANPGGSHGIPPGPCNVQMGFVNAAGTTLKTSNPTIQPGQAAFLTLSFAEASASLTAADSRTRVNIRPVLTTVPPDPCRSVSSVELFDALSRDQAYGVPAEAPGAVAPLDPEFGVVGITALDALRVNISNVTGSNGFPPGPCNVQMGFVNAEGVAVKMITGEIDPGHTADVAITYFEAASAALSAVALARIDLRPQVTVPPGPCRVAVSTELLDAITGATRVYVLPAVQPNLAAPVVSTNAVGQ